MSRVSLGAIGGLLAIFAAVAWSIAWPDRNLGPRSEKPALALLTSLPLVFGESFGLEKAGSPALARLEGRYMVEPIAVADAASLNGRRLLLMAHPRAQPAEALVELDRWVRGGGRVLLLADPRLDWASERPLGDMLRPPPSFVDTGLLAHWEVSLDGPVVQGPAERRADGFELMTSSPGRLESGSCEVNDEGLVARCRIGKGQATIIADADFIDAGKHGSDNLNLLIGELDRLENR